MIRSDTLEMDTHFTSGIKRHALDWQDPLLFDALEALPEDEDFPHELIRLLAQPRGGRRKTIWLLTQGGEPIAVAPLRQQSAFSWQPITQYILPGIVIPAAHGKLYPALGAVGHTLHIALWGVNCDLPSSSLVRELSTTVTHRMSCAGDFEAYWKSTDIWRSLRSAKNKSTHLTLRENAPGASEWIISSWAKKWGIAEDETQDRILAAQFLEKRGKHFSLTLFDGDRPVAGQTCLSHRGEMIAQCLYRENDSNSLGNRIIHLTFCWAKEKGFRAIDIGGGYDYKRKFAPPAGEEHAFVVAPRWRYATEQALRGIKRRVIGAPARWQQSATGAFCLSLAHRSENWAPLLG